MNHCSNCGQDFEGNFCPNCGKVVGDFKCPRCGAEISGNFCPNCGYSVHGANTTEEKPAKKRFDISKIKDSAAIGFVRRHWISLLLCTMLLVAFMTLMITLVGLRGIYVNVNNSNDFYDFDAVSYRSSITSSLFGDSDELEEGKWKLSGGKLTLTVNDELFGKISDDFDFEKLDGYKRIKIDRFEYKRVSLVGINTTKKQLKVTFDAQGGNGGTTKKIKIGTKLPSLESWGIEAPTHNDGYTFIGWYTEPNGQGYSYGEGDRVWENCTFYAYWLCTTHVSATYEFEGDTHWQICERCGEEFNRGQHNITWVTTVPVTCTENGQEAYQCVCGYKEKESYETRDVIAPGHVLGDWIVEGASKCGDTGKRHRDCQNCDYSEVEDPYIIPHDFDPGTKECKICHSTIFATGDRIYFGEYPQTRVYDNGIIATLSQMSGAKPVKGNSGLWINYGYYIESAATEYMWYIDITYQDVKYRGVYFISYRPNYIKNSSSVENATQDDNKYNVNTLYWFRWEPIEWRVLEKTDGEMFLMSNRIIDAQAYQNESTHQDAIYYSSSNGAPTGTYANNYKYSSIRNWLNNTFFNWAFDSAEQDVIKLTDVDNSAATTSLETNMYACENTSDKVFLLSYKELRETKYGFSSDYNSSSTRELRTTDYAVSQGAYKSTDSNHAYSSFWWMRTPHFSDTNSAYYVDESGFVNRAVSAVGYTACGVVPAIKIQ